MYEWLEKEINEVKTQEFHVIKGGVLDLSTGIYSSLPPSYVAFVCRFGSVKLYKNITNNSYQLGVICPPKEKFLNSRENFLHIGHFDDAPAYFRSSLLVPGKESPVFEWTEEGLERIADSFEKWLIQRCIDARNFYTKLEWQNILNPQPFTGEEAAIVEARRQFKWKLVGFDKDGNMAIAVQNNSKLVLPYLSIGVKAKDGTLEGGLWLDVSGVLPGQERVIKHPGYKELIAPDITELYPLPDPLPSDRERFWEFRNLILN